MNRTGSVLQLCGAAGLVLIVALAVWWGLDGDGTLGPEPEPERPGPEEPGPIARGMGVAEILRRLRALHIGPLPHWVEIKVRAWGHYYGDAALQTLNLVQIRDQATLRELLSEPELKDILQPFQPAPERALAVVSTADLDSLYEIFARHGISIKKRLE